MFSIKRTSTGALVACAFALSAGSSLAQDLGNGWEPNPLEVAKLPEYCKVFFRTKALPPNCDGVHHLCAGRVLMTRITNPSIPKQERKRIYNRAKQEVDYIFGRPNPPTCKMMDEARATQSELRVLEVFVR